MGSLPALIQLVGQATEKLENTLFIVSAITLVYVCMYVCM